MAGQNKKHNNTIKYLAYGMLAIGVLSLVCLIFPILDFAANIVIALLMFVGGFILLQTLNFQEGKPVMFMPKEQQYNLQPQYQPDAIPNCKNCLSQLTRVEDEQTSDKQQHLLCDNCGRETIVGRPNWRHNIRIIYEGDKQKASTKTKILEGLKKAGANAGNVKFTEGATTQG